MEVDELGEAGRLVLDEPRDAHAAALLLAPGAAIAHGFANIYAITAMSDAETVRRVNTLKGRPADQVGSLTAPSDRVFSQFDLGRLPTGLTADQVFAVVNALQAVGPIGFRGPAASHVPAYLTALVEGVRTTQVIVPGAACPSASFLAQCWAEVAGGPLFITSANRSHYSPGRPTPRRTGRRAHCAKSSRARRAWCSSSTPMKPWRWHGSRGTYRRPRRSSVFTGRRW